MAQIIAAIEVLDNKEFWTVVKEETGEEEDILDKFKTIKEQLKKDFKIEDDRIRITTSKFRILQRKWRDDE